MLKLYLIFLFSYGHWLEMKQKELLPCERDYSYIEFYRKTYEIGHPEAKPILHAVFRKAEAFRDYHTGVLKEFKTLVQLDPEPELAMQEPCWDIYKISLSFQAIGEI